MKTQNIIINEEIGKKIGKLTNGEDLQLAKTFNFFITDKQPNLPPHLLKLYEEIKNYNLAHNEELKKEIEAQHEKK